LSEIYGVWRFNGQPVKASLDTMQAASLSRRPDSTTQWRQDHVGLGQILRHDTPESVYENQPMQAAGVVMVADARLDYRDDLLRKLNIPAAEADQLPDGRLIELAYAKWGLDCVKQIEGDWTFAVWDAARNQLLLARDHHGNTGLFYYRALGVFAFASSIARLLALDDVPKEPNLNYLAQRLAVCPMPGESTAYCAYW
jgi:asparagine synthase (glutamine-hydrolysing)